MSVASDPLQTRCLPASPCLRMPPALVAWDSQLRESLVLSPQTQKAEIDALRWVVEEPAGLALLMAVFLGVFIACFRWPSVLNSKRLGLRLFVLILGIGASDIACTGLKVFFGRLKPYVIFYNPGFLPALSFPSNHAFNTSVLCTLFYWQVERLRPRFAGGRWAFGFFVAVLIVFICGSRVVLGEHYPLDVAGGILLGSLFAMLYSSLVRLATSTKPL